MRTGGWARVMGSDGQQVDTITTRRLDGLVLVTMAVGTLPVQKMYAFTFLLAFGREPSTPGTLPYLLANSFTT